MVNLSKFKLNDVITKHLPNIIARGLQLMLGIVTTLMVARGLSASDLGVYYLIFGAGIAFNAIVLNGLYFPIQRLLPAAEDARSAFISTICLTTVILLALLIILIFVASHTAVYATGIVKLSLVTVAFAVSETISLQVTNLAAAFRAHWSYSASTLFRSVTIMTLIYYHSGLTMQATDVLFYFMIGNILAIAGIAQIIIPKIHPARWRYEILRESLQYSLPYSFTSIFEQAFARGDRYVVAYFIGLEAAGFYSLASDLCRRTIQGLSVTARLSFIQDAIEFFDSADRMRLQETIIKMTGTVLSLGLAASMVIGLFGADLVKEFIPYSTAEAIQPMLAIIPFAYTLAMLRTYVVQLPFELSGQGWRDTQIASIGVVAMIVCLVVFLPPFGLLGGAIAVFTSQVIIVIYARLVMRLSQIFDANIPVGKSMLLIFTLTGTSMVNTFWYPFVPELDLWSLITLSAVTGTLSMASVSFVFRSRKRT